ncbi:MAG: hypothetical protein RR904_04430 [Bacilli bacterium]
MLLFVLSSFTNSKEGFTKLLDTINPVINSIANVLISMEATGSY